MSNNSREFYLRYYVGHIGKYGHECLEFELRADGRLRYSNDTKYKNDSIIRKEVYVSQAVVEEFKRIIIESGISTKDTNEWPKPDKVGEQELEISYDNVDLFIKTTKIGALAELTTVKDPEGMKDFYYLAQDLRSFVLSLISLHFRVKPV